MHGFAVKLPLALKRSLSSCRCIGAHPRCRSTDGSNPEFVTNHMLGNVPRKTGEFILCGDHQERVGTSYRRPEIIK